MAWCRIGDKRLSEPMLTWFTDVYMQHEGTWVKLIHSQRNHENPCLCYHHCVWKWPRWYDTKLQWWPGLHYYVHNYVARTRRINITLYSTHWGRVTHICEGKLTIIGSENGLSPGRYQAIWSNAGIWLIGPLGTNFIEILTKWTPNGRHVHIQVHFLEWKYLNSD